jgi:hypothetical protein
MLSPLEMNFSTAPMSFVANENVIRLTAIRPVAR